ncbi:MAG: hypothetical protein ACLUDU_12105 [Butyricimonas faecihominis]
MLEGRVPDDFYAKFGDGHFLASDPELPLLGATAPLWAGRVILTIR